MIQQFYDFDSFQNRVGDFFTKTPVHHAPILKVMTSLSKNPNQYGEKAPQYFCICDENEKILGAALQTPPHPMVLTDMANSAICLLVEYLRQHQIEIYGARGPMQPARLFTALWKQMDKAELSPRVELKLYSLQEVKHKVRGEGRLVQATEEHFEQVHAWIKAFSKEVSLPAGGPSKERIAFRVQQGEYFFWQVGDALTCVLAKNATPNHGVSHIGPVYTPPEHRGHGYATDASAVLSQVILDEGASYSSLFADLHNRSTNKIYQMIGYEEISIHNVYYFAE